jgi:hypothetical protein
MERLDTTNLILIVLAVASIVQTLVAVALAYGALRAYHSTAQLLDTRLTPSLMRLEGLLTNLERTTAVVRTRTDDVNRAIDHVRGTATELGAVMLPRAAAVAAVVGGVLGVVRRWRRARPRVRVVAG